MKKTIQVEAPVDVTVECVYPKGYELSESDIHFIQKSLEEGMSQGELDGCFKTSWRKISKEKLHYA